MESIDTHSIILVHFIKRALAKNRNESSNPQIQTGAKLLWRNYFRYADARDYITVEPLSSVIERLLIDLSDDTDDMRCIKAYRTVFKLPCIKN